MAEQARLLYSMVPLLRAAELRSLDGYPAAIGAYNVNFYAQAEGILRGLAETDAPGIIQASKGANEFQGGPDKIQYMVLEAIKNLGFAHPVALHLDHGSEKAAIECVDKGFSSVMIDASELEEQDNIATTGRIVRYAHKRGVSVEGEYGLLKGVEEDVAHKETTYADPKFVPVLFDRSGADALAIAYGTSHGPNKGRTDALDLGVVAQSYAGLKAYGMNLDHFLVSHGSSRVPPDFVAKINQYGGKLSGTSGVPLYMIDRAIALGMRKVNIDTDLRLAMTGEVRRWLTEDYTARKLSALVALIDDVFKGKIKAVEKGKVVPPEELKDPRSWLQPVMEANPDALRGDYRKTENPAFINLMTLISNTVARHVAQLNREFGSAGLAGKVDTSLTLEEMAAKYAA